jgi:hypothetical protein
LERRGEHTDAVREYETCRTVFAAELGCDPGPRLRAVFRRLLAATSEQDDRLRDLVAAVVRLHHVLDASTSERPAESTRDEHPSAAGEPGALQEDCSRLMALIRAADARARALAGQAAAMAATATG